ncbi:hypothetical protein [Streptomyces ossamyceticus]|uniref:hypothetical protein n=1 Tax=Streptomyces ossamyceticus TaxID=249581 RepID=UPI0012FF1C0F|nr:hypothetical protein [Streptomyces ossamyceticus]
MTILLQNLKHHSRSCGCTKRKDTMSEAFRNRGRRPRLFVAEPGMRFVRLTVLQEERKRMPNGAYVWVAHCQCDCGQETTATVNNLKNGQVQSCGCLHRERVAATNALRATHGLSDHPHYHRWRNMMGRCYDRRDPHYANWGARGISVCSEWHDPQTFVRDLDKLLGPCPEGHSLDRIDNDGNYEPGNVRWATPLTQRHNQRRAQNP